tara:strand:- start:3023 stop:4609 length:1587 start_codon:yes stop_codon:yes gene_type:complete
MISEELADEYMPDHCVRHWGLALANFPKYELGDDPDPLGLARRVRNHFHSRVNQIAQEEIDVYYHAVRKARLKVNNDHIHGSISDEQCDALLHMLRNTYSAYRSVVSDQIELIVNTMLPNHDLKSAGFLALWLDQKGRDRGREGRIILRSGKGIRKMFPCLTDKEIETLNDEYRHEFSVKELTIHFGQTRADFVRAKHGPIGKLENPDTSSGRKFLGNSCMRYDFIDTRKLPMQPTEAYASGDFTVYWTEDNSGKICSNVIVYDASENDPVAAPIYGVCEKSIDTLQELLSEKGIELYSHHNGKRWSGARLLRFDYEDGEYVGPYLDVQPQILRKTGCGKYLVVDRHGDISGTTYQGILYGDGQSCSCCNDSIRRGNEYYYNHDTYCSDCYHDRIRQCSYCGDDTEIDDCTTVQTETSDYEEYCSHCTHQHTVVTCSGETWLESDTRVTANGDTISVDEYDASYFTSDWDGEIYPDHNLAPLENGDSVSLTEVANHPDYYLCDDTGLWKEKPDDNSDDNNPTTPITES